MKDKYLFLGFLHLCLPVLIMGITLYYVLVCSFAYSSY